MHKSPLTFVLLPLSLLALVNMSCDPATGEPEVFDGPTYIADIAPLMNQQCLSCHAEGGLAPFPLETFEQATNLAPAIAATVSARTMPPVIADVSGDCGDFREQAYLSDDEIALIAEWADNPVEGSGELPELISPPAPLDGDLILDMGFDYTPNADQEDDYRCFVIETDNDVDRFITAYDVVPGDSRVVHHVVIYSPESEAAAAQARNLDSADETPGYECFGSANVSSSLIAGWAPGTVSTILPEGTGLRVPAGRPIIVQMHYNTAQGVYSDRTQIVMKTEASVEDEAFATFIGTFNFLLQPGLEVETAQHAETLNLPPNGLKLWGIFPHMHTLGRKMNFRMVREGEESCITDVPRYDFDWQQYFYLNEPMQLEDGDVLRLDCEYDTTSRSEPIGFGDGTSDEMCLVAVYYTL